MHDILEESWAYQEMVQKGLLQGLQKGREEGRQQGREEGRQQGYQQAAIDMVVAHFPDLEALARTKITAIDDLECLQHLIIDLSISHTREQMEQVLLSLDGIVLLGHKE